MQEYNSKIIEIEEHLRNQMDGVPDNIFAKDKEGNFIIEDKARIDKAIMAIKSAINLNSQIADVVKERNKYLESLLADPPIMDNTGIFTGTVVGQSNTSTE